MSEEAPLRDLTIYLLKPDVKAVRDALRAPDRLKDFKLNTVGGSLIGELFVKPPKPHPPAWAEFFQDHIDPAELGRVSSTSAVFLLKTLDRIFAIAFGQGRYLLVPDSWEERFGLKTVLNSIEPDRLRSLDKRTFDALSTQSRIQSNREGAAPDFGLDIEQDLVRAVTGKPSDENFGRMLSGMDSLHCSVRVTLDSIKPVLRQYLAKSESDDYRKSFPWVDHIAEVTDRTVIASLDEAMVAVVNGTRDRCWLCVPEIINWANTSGFRYSLTSRAPAYSDLHFEGFFESFNAPVDLEALKRRRASRVDNQGIVLDDWAIYRCVYCELDHEGKSYVLSGGKWYRIDSDFVESVNEFYAALPRYDDDLPEYNDADEGKYCERVAEGAGDRFALMDKKLIPIGGAHGKVEFCDLFTARKDLIHVKRYGASSVLSHLFSQGVVSGEAFRADADYRSEALKLLPAEYRFFDAKAALAASDYQVVFAVISDKQGDLKLPFFSRVNIRHACRRLNAFGYKTALAKIKVADELAKLKKYEGK